MDLLSELTTDRLLLPPVTAEHVAAVTAGHRLAGWAADFPSEGDEVIAGMLDRNGVPVGPDTVFGQRLVVENLETRRRRVFVPGSVAVVSALRQMVTGVLAEKVALAVSAKRVPQLERDIAALDGREFGKNSIGAQAKTTPAA